ncbi:hypothetical protein C7I85_04780 [Mesorhizobium soli]|uniref:Uncharacterized protein n=1 Tax=Pseudaminobacter soli (ex Li et al. 2025) TaxID=1295366 RepID=A0A2P7SKN4_9HYPH|nr:hypothetical protein C7I85_04780 [Mesorhizobium soli]
MALLRTACKMRSLTQPLTGVCQVTEPEKDNRTDAQKRAEIRSSIITWAVFIGGLALAFATVDFFLIAE